MRSTVIICLMAFATTCPGCSEPLGRGDATVQGAVTIDGELAVRGTVEFHPVDGGPTAYGEIRKDGTYALRIGQGAKGNLDGSMIDSGDYVGCVVVTMPSSNEKRHEESGPPAPGVRLTAAKYSNKATSDLLFKVKAGRNVIPLELEAATEDLSPQESVATDEETEPPAIELTETEAGEPKQAAGPKEEVSK